MELEPAIVSFFTGVFSFVAISLLFSMLNYLSLFLQLNLVLLNDRLLDHGASVKIHSLNLKFHRSTLLWMPIVQLSFCCTRTSHLHCPDYIQQIHSFF